MHDNRFIYKYVNSDLYLHDWENLVEANIKRQHYILLPNHPSSLRETKHDLSAICR